MMCFRLNLSNQQDNNNQTKNASDVPSTARPPYDVTGLIILLVLVLVLVLEPAFVCCVADWQSAGGCCRSSAFTGGWTLEA
jgi:hypothetical protein